MHEGDLTWLVGGPQGSGINVSAEVFAKAAMRAGRRVFANIEYHSNIMGEHSFYRVRLSREQRHSFLDEINVLTALDEETLIGGHSDFPGHMGHLAELVPGASPSTIPAAASTRVTSSAMTSRSSACHFSRFCAKCSRSSTERRTRRASGS